MFSSRRIRGTKNVSFLQTEEERWLGDEIRDIAILNKHIDKLHGLRVIVSFSDNSLLLCEIKLNEKFDPSILKSSLKPINRKHSLGVNFLILPLL